MTALLDGIPSAGRDAALVRGIRSLARDAAGRRRENACIAEGIHLALEALKSPGRIRAALLSPRILRTEEGREAAARLVRERCEARRVDDRLLASLSDVESHQGVLLVLDRPAARLVEILGEPSPPLVLVACGIQDPGNLGALARIAESAWAAGMVCAEGGADPFSARSLRASAGSLLRLPVLERAGAADAARDLRTAGLRLIGASSSAGTGYREADLTGGLAIFVGSEGAGLPASLEGTLDGYVRIPIRDGVESLNVAAAAAVIFFEAAAKRRG